MEYQEDEDATLNEDVDWRENDRQVSKAKYRSKIQQEAREPTQEVDRLKIESWT